MVTPFLSPCSQIGINPGLLSAYKGHHYPNPGNHFCRLTSTCRGPVQPRGNSSLVLCAGKCLFLSGFTQTQLDYSHDQSLPQTYGIGFTNMVERTTPGSKDLSKWVWTRWRTRREACLGCL